MTAKTVRIPLMIAATAALLLAADASAQSASSTFQVTASVAANCRIQAAADVAISTVAAPWDPTDGTYPTAPGTITVRCTRGTVYDVELNNGVYSDAMQKTDDATETLPYRILASDCSTAFTRVDNFTATSRAAQDHDFCVGIDPTDPLAVDPLAGDYADTVAVDVTF